MNLFNMEASQAGLAFITANPEASSVEIDEAATKHSPFDPARHHFQQACHGWQFIHPYHWTMTFGPNQGKGGGAMSWKGALECISRANHMAQASGKKVLGWHIYDRNDVCVADMTST